MLAVWELWLLDACKHPGDTVCTTCGVTDVRGLGGIICEQVEREGFKGVIHVQSLSASRSTHTVILMQCCPLVAYNKQQTSTSYCKIIIYSNILIEKMCFSLFWVGKFSTLYKTMCKTVGVTFTNIQEETAPC